MKKIFTLLVFTFILLYAGPGWATVYYSQSIEEATDPLSWIDIDGNSPVDFTNPADEFRITNSDIMIVSVTGWTVAGKIVIEGGATLDGGSNNPKITIDMEPGAIYYMGGSYTNLTLGTVDITAQIHFVGTSLSRDLPYPTLYVEGSSSINLTTPNLRVFGDLYVGKPFNIVTNSTSKTVTVNQSVYITNGTLRLINAGTTNVGSGNASMTVAGDFNINSGTGAFSTNNTTTWVTGTSTLTIGGSLNIGAGVFSGPSSPNSTATATINVTGDFNMTGGTFNGVISNTAANATYNIQGNFLYQGGTYIGKSGSGTGLATINLLGNGDVISNTMSNSNQKVNISGNYGLQTNFTIGNALTLSSGNLSLNGHILTLNNALTITSGTLTGDNTSGITFGAASVGASLPTVTLGTLTVNRTGQIISLAGNVTVANTLGLSAGTLSIGSDTLTLGGAINGSGTLSGSITSNLILNGSGSLNLPAITLQNLRINRGTSDVISLAGPTTIYGTLFLTKGQLDNSANTLTIVNNGNISKDLGELTALPSFAGLVNLAYTGLNVVSTGYELPSGTATLNNLTISKTGGVGLSLISDVYVNGTFTITTGAKLNAGVQTLSVKGNWINNGTFTAGSSSVNFAGTTVMSGSVVNTTFNNFSISSGASLTVPASSNTTILGDATITAPVTFNANSGTFTYGGSNNQTIASLNYYNLTSTSTGGRSLSGVIGIANVFTPGTNSYSTAGSTIDFNGSGNQTINNFTYYNLAVSNSGTKTPSGTSLSVNDLTISGSAILAGNAKTINVAGNWTSYGAAGFSEAGSKVVFNGSNPQTINTTGGEVFADLTMNSSSTTALNSLVTVNGIVALTNGTLVSGGNLSINLNTANIDYTAGDAGSISGNIKVSKSIGAYKTHYLACPLNGVTVADFADNTPVINTSNGATRLYEYKNAKWNSIYDMNFGLTPFNGYSLYFLAPTTLDYTGTYSHGSVPSAQSFPNTTSDFQMVGNPYPSTLDWNSGGWAKTNLNNAIYYWDAANGRYASYVGGVGSNGGTQYIPALQGFFVTTTGTGGTSSISVTNTARTTSATPALWRTSSESPSIIKLITQNGSLSDETVLKFSEDATENFDGNLDAYKLRNSGSTPNLSSVSNDISYSINSLPPVSEFTSIPLKVAVATNGTYTIKANEISGLDSNEVILEDKLLNIEHDLKSSEGYAVALTKADTLERFVIKFRKADVVTTLNNLSTSKVVVNATGKTVNVYFANLQEKEASIVFLNVIGQEVDKAENVNISQGVYTKDLNVSTGIYIVKVKVGSKVFTEKVYINN